MQQHLQFVEKVRIMAKPIPSPGGTPQGGLSCLFEAIHLQVAPEGGRKTAPAYRVRRATAEGGS